MYIYIYFLFTNLIKYCFFKESVSHKMQKWWFYFYFYFYYEHFYCWLCSNPLFIFPFFRMLFMRYCFSVFRLTFHSLCTQFTATLASCLTLSTAIIVIGIPSLFFVILTHTCALIKMTNTIQATSIYTSLELTMYVYLPY